MGASALLVLVLSGIRRHVPSPFGICVDYQRNEKATTKASEDEIK